MNEKELTTLLRLKRHELPPPGYHTRFLAEFHRRQRAELLHRPLWRICLDRLENLFADFTIPRSAYGAATAIFVGLVAVGIVANDQPQTTAQAEGGSSPDLTFVDASPQQQVALPLWDNLPELPVAAPTTVVRNSSEIPRYVLDVRPVSYEAPFSF